MLVTGDPVNVAKRLEEVARTGEILVGDSTRRLVENAVLLEPRDELTVKGKSGPVVAWNVLAVIEGASPYARRLDAPLVGRARELALLRETFASVVADRSCRLVTVFGPAGIGKSRLATELSHEVRTTARTLSGRCLPYGDGITFWPLVQIIGALGSDDGVRALLADSEDGDLIAERVLSAVGPTGSSTPSGELFWAVRRLLEEAARQQPLVVTVEDIHWAAPKLLDLLEYLAGWTHDAPVLLLCLSRPELLEERQSWLTVPNATGIVLLPLTDAEADVLLDEIGQEWPLDDAARAGIKEAAEGNPLYLEQMAAMLAEGGPDRLDSTVDPCAARGEARPPARRRARRVGTCRRRRQGVRARRGAAALGRARARRTRRAAPQPDAQGPARCQPRPRGRLPVPARADPRRGVRRHREGAEGRAPQALRRLGDRDEGRTRRRARRDRRLPLRTVASVPTGARATRRRQPAAWPIARACSSATPDAARSPATTPRRP